MVLIPTSSHEWLETQLRAAVNKASEWGKEPRAFSELVFFQKSLICRAAAWSAADIDIGYHNTMILLGSDTTTRVFRHTQIANSVVQCREYVQNSIKSSKTVDFPKFANFVAGNFSVCSTDFPCCCLISITYP